MHRIAVFVEIFVKWYLYYYSYTVNILDVIRNRCIRSHRCKIQFEYITNDNLQWKMCLLNAKENLLFIKKSIKHDRRNVLPKRNDSSNEKFVKHPTLNTVTVIFTKVSQQFIPLEKDV